MTTLGLALASIFLALGFWAHSFTLIPQLFKLNKECQEEGYYMAEFEFKMVGLAYRLDHGEYFDAIQTLRALHTQLKERKGLVKVPKFKSKDEEMDFYLSLQNPKTGAFMDDSYPYCTFEGPTGNILIILEELSKQTGRPIKLKYPLKFLDQIKDPEQLSAYLNDIAYIGWIGQKLPESTFHLVRDLSSYARTDNLVERNHLYAFSPEWKRTLLKWLYDNQDPETGYWGPKSRTTGKMTKVDMHNTGSIVKSFVDVGGANLNAEFPLRYRDKMVLTTLGFLAEPAPPKEDLDEWHGWTLRNGKTAALLTRFLWNGISEETKQKTKEQFLKFLAFRFDEYYLPKDGAFRYYAGAEHPTLDGTGTILSNLADIGYLSPEKRVRIWGTPESMWQNFGKMQDQIQWQAIVQKMLSDKRVNSVRIYNADSVSDLHGQALWLCYPNGNRILDATELIPKIKSWADTTKQSLGNWVSRQSILDDLQGFPTTAPSMVPGKSLPEKLTSMLSAGDTITVISFDALQLPIGKLTIAPL